MGAGKIIDHAPANVAVSLHHLRPHQRVRLEHGDRERQRAAVHASCLVEGKGRRNAGDHGGGEGETARRQPGAGRARLVNLRLEFSEARFDDDHSVHHGLLRFRANRTRRAISRRSSAPHFLSHADSSPYHAEMVSQKGKDLFSKIDTTALGTSSPSPASLAARRLQQRDGGHHRADSAGRWRELLAAVGSNALRSAAPASSRTPVRRLDPAAILFRRIVDWQLAVPGFRRGRGTVPDHLARIFRQP